MSHYANLGLEPTATSRQIKAAYDELSIVVHPANGGDPHMFRILSENYRILIDPSSRAAYDIELPGGAENPPPPRWAPTPGSAGPSAQAILLMVTVFLVVLAGLPFSGVTWMLLALVVATVMLVRAIMSSFGNRNKRV